MRKLPLADRLRVRSPCPVPGSWDAMPSDGAAHVRFCASCNLHVHEVAELTRAEAEDLMRSRERGKRVCLRLHVRRSDGAVLLADGFALPSRALAGRRLAGAIATVSAATLAACAPATQAPPPVRTADPVHAEVPAATAPEIAVVAPARALALAPPAPELEVPSPVSQAPEVAPPPAASTATARKAGRAAAPATPAKTTKQVGKPRTPPAELDIVNGGAW